MTTTSFIQSPYFSELIDSAKKSVENNFARKDICAYLAKRHGLTTAQVEFILVDNDILDSNTIFYNIICM